MADNRAKPYRHRTVKKGEVYQFEFGKNYHPEMSYEHRGLVIGVKQKLLYVLPIFSYIPAKHISVFHPIDFPDSKSDLLLLKNSEFPFISHDSVLKLNDIRTVSVNRILYQQSGAISPSSDFYKQIERLVLKKYFPSFYHEYDQLNQKMLDLYGAYEECKKKLEHLIAENKDLKNQLSFLNDQ